MSETGAGRALGQAAAEVLTERFGWPAAQVGEFLCLWGERVIANHRHALERQKLAKIRSQFSPAEWAALGAAGFAQLAGEDEAGLSDDQRRAVKKWRKLGGDQVMGAILAVMPEAWRAELEQTAKEWGK